MSPRWVLVCGLAVVTAGCARAPAAPAAALVPPPVVPAPAVQLGPPVLVGTGGADGFVTSDASGRVHVAFGGRYRTGTSASALGPEEVITDLPFHTVRMTVDPRGRPHVVFTAGQSGAATVSYYTARIDGRWLPPEAFADAAQFAERERAYVADVAADERGHVLVSFWVSRPRDRRRELEDPSFYYRWRRPEGTWAEPRSLPAFWSSAPKVEHLPGGFLLLWQRGATDWRIAGPVAAGQPFVDPGRPAGSATLVGVNHVQNEGADFAVLGGDHLVVAGNVRERFEGPVGVWASLVRGDADAKARYLGSFPGTKRGQESGVHPVLVADRDTGHVVLAVRNPGDGTAVFAYHTDTWLPGTSPPGTAYSPLLAEHPAPHGTTRQGPSLADVPGPGVLALVRDASLRWYLRPITCASAGARERASRETAVARLFPGMTRAGFSGAP